MANINETTPDPSAPVVSPLPNGKTVYIPYTPNQPTTTTIQTGQPEGGFLGAVLPALQSGSYVILIVLGFVLWSSRSLAKDFMVKHINLVESLKENIDTQLDTAKTQMEVLKQLTDNNATLARTLENGQSYRDNLRQTADK